MNPHTKCNFPYHQQFEQLQCFVGYGSHSKTYHFLKLDYYIIIELRDADFFFFFLNLILLKALYYYYFFKASTSNKKIFLKRFVLENEENFEVRKSKRIRKVMSFDSDLITYFIKGNSHIIVYEFGMCYNLENEPSSFEETMKSRDAMF